MKKALDDGDYKASYFTEDILRQMNAEKDPVVGGENRHKILALARLVGGNRGSYGSARIGELVKVMLRGETAKLAMNSRGDQSGRTVDRVSCARTVDECNKFIEDSISRESAKRDDPTKFLRFQWEVAGGGLFNDETPAVMVMTASGFGLESEVITVVVVHRMVSKIVAAGGIRSDAERRERKPRECEESAQISGRGTHH